MKGNPRNSATYPDSEQSRSVPKYPARTPETRNGSGWRRAHSEAKRSEAPHPRRMASAATRNNATAYVIEETLAACHQLELRTLAMKLGADELGVLVAIAYRLTAGRKTYGELRLAREQRNFAVEALEESLDMAIYAAAGLTRAAQLAAEQRFAAERARHAPGTLSEKDRRALARSLPDAFAGELSPRVVSHRDRASWRRFERAGVRRHLVATKAYTAKGAERC